MKYKFWVLLIPVLVCVTVLAVSCLMPPGPPKLVLQNVGDCVLPKTTITPMHTRDDVKWPTARCRQTAAETLAKMSLDEKIGQMVQPDRGQLTTDADIGSYQLGSVLAGGSTDPRGGNHARDWAKMANVIHESSVQNDHRIPALFGVDAVHGHNNVLNTVIFPHNIGLGCTRNPELIERIGRVTAKEIAATGVDWTFAPVLAAARDERWGRTYEAFGETPELAAELGAAMVRGLQGERLGAGRPSVLACAKHFAADGGTQDGRDQGNAEGDLDAIRKRHVDQFGPVVKAGVGSIMASYSSVNTVKMHCHGPLLTDVLKGEMGFNGFVISDWEAVTRIPGTYKEQLASAINAGIDMVMAEKAYPSFIKTVEKLVPDEITAARIDDAVGRILSVKCELGMLDPGYFPLDDAGAIAFKDDLLKEVGSKEHRAVAREAVQQSLVMLKNDGDLLPLKKDMDHYLVAGKNGNDLGRQCGGWTISWQGSGGDITKGTTVFKAIQNAVAPTGIGPKVTFSYDGSGGQGASVAIAVIGEKPYAEGDGDEADLVLDEDDVKTVRELKAAGLKVVVILVSGRPRILGEVLDLADAFIAAWLPGTEGDGIADVLFGDVAPTGRLSHSWPRSMDQVPINVGDASYDPLFPYGFGLTYGGVLGEEDATDEPTEPDAGVTRDTAS